MRVYLLLKLLLFFVLAVNCLAQPKSKYNVKEVEVDADFLLIPISAQSNYREIKITAEDESVIMNEAVMLATGKGQWYAPIDVSKYKGQKLKVAYRNDDFIGEPIILLGDGLFQHDYSKDIGRPKFHITATNGILGASSGLCYFNGNYYAYILQNPKLFSANGTFNLCLWKSSDLVNWSVVQSADLLKSVIKAPSSVYVDKSNKSKLFSINEHGLIFACTNENNNTFIAFASDPTKIKPYNNASPVLEGEGKWPYIFYNEDAKLWTILRTETLANGKGVVAIYVSEDFKKWEKTSTAFSDIGDSNVNLFKLDVIGKGNEQKWVMLSGEGKYIVGDFDGRTFKQTSPKALRIFSGTVSFVQVWNNVVNNQILATATIEQPISVMRHIKQGFINTLSIPWHLSLVRVSDGQIQLRANIPEQIMEHTGITTDVAGAEMTFYSNTFIVPNAYGNYCIYDGIFEVDKTLAVSVEVGVGAFGYSMQNSQYFMRRLTNEFGRWDMPVARKLMFIPFKAVVDSYSVEFQWLAGDIILMMGDSFINENQTVKVGAVGDTRIKELKMLPIFKSKVKDLRNAILEMYKQSSIENNSQKPEAENTANPSSSTQQKQ
ncbi:MAG: glycoside hydrolase family 32 protein [Verrucomicrobiaceae bacterium]|nr:glycoside hydrolase family 32 protein [Verrucomicrobiaceae bacterium]